ncbi:MAG: MarR family transcriptional regulator [Massilia sp.]|jgi:MarR family transcriptional repressor of emrRAB|nr:MarR family transcriptional regulator [Massilia sp.]
MSGFASTNKRLQTIQARMPEFPLEPMRLVRMTYHLQRILREKTNAALKAHELADASYMVLAVLYGSPNETSSASELGEACYEKPANLTRVCDDLQARGLLARGEKPGDRRSVMISLTQRGRDVIEQALPDVATQVSVAYRGFSDTEMRQFATMYERVLHNLSCPE